MKSNERVFLSGYLKRTWPVKNKNMSGIDERFNVNMCPLRMKERSEEPMGMVETPPASANNNDSVST